MQTRFTSCFTSGTPNADINLEGMARFPFPCQFVSLNLLHVNIPFDFPIVAESGWISLTVTGGSTNLLVVNGNRYNYTWLLPFEPGGLTGNFQWFTQAGAGGDDLHHMTHFTPNLNISVSFVTAAGLAALPPTTVGRLCSLEIGVRPKL